MDALFEKLGSAEPTIMLIGSRGRTEKASF
jgi:hypothetical protein